MYRAAALLAVVLAAAGCRADGECAPADGEDEARWRPVCAALDDSKIAAMTVLIGDAGGRRLTYVRGDASPDEVTASASAAKWLASATIMRVVEDGLLSLDSRPQDFFGWASDDEADPRSAMTLRHLLSFTAGFDVKPFDRTCVGARDSTTEACARELYEERHVSAPGTAYFYGPASLKVAAAMVEAATGASFQESFRARVADVVGMSEEAGFVAPSEQNPNVAGGAQLSAADYERLLHAVVRGDLLAASLDEMHADHTPSGEVEIVYSPTSGTGYAWHYALGNWRECYEAVWSAACSSTRRVSSPGAFGMYPWIDFDGEHWGILATKRLGATDSVLAVHRAREEIAAALAPGE